MNIEAFPFCKQTIKYKVPQHFLNLDWLAEQETLINKRSGFGISADVTCMKIVELWHLYQYLRGLSI